MGSQIQRELAQLVHDHLGDTRLGMVTIQAVRLVRDFSLAKVYYTTLDAKLNLQDVTKHLNDAAPHLRHELGNKVRLRTLPALLFVHDESIERGVRLSALIEQAVAADQARHK